MTKLERSRGSPAVPLFMPLLLVVAVALLARGTSAECLTNDGRFGKRVRKGLGSAYAFRCVSLQKPWPALAYGTQWQHAQDMLRRAGHSRTSSQAPCAMPRTPQEHS